MITHATLEWNWVTKNVDDVRESTACPINMFATVVLSILFITLIIGCTNDTGESSTRHALSVSPML